MDTGHVSSLYPFYCLQLRQVCQRMIQPGCQIILNESKALIVAATTVGVLEYTGSEHEMEYRGRQYEVLDGAISITVAVTSLLVTLLICYRIHIRTKDVLR